ncbi:hypothetical protein MKW92_000941 [Papaver armeniacum]|nr:hypothetical protein MKW92_000941 [Papaver armeniacum]
MGFSFKSYHNAFLLISLFILIISSLLEHAHARIIKVGTCDYSQGSWVVDASYPLYDSSKCPFISEGFDCVDNGRPNKDYLNYKWSPTGCPAPKFDGQDLVKRVKGKKVMFVGDSVSQNQWQSFSCLIHAAIPNAKYAINYGEKYSSVNFTDPEYDIASIFNQKPFFVDFEEKPERVLKIDTISTSDVWKEVDILIFNSWHWWHHTGRLQHWDKIQEGAQTYKDIDDRMEAFKKGLTTWSTWVDKNIDPKKTQVFYQGISPAHLSGDEWGFPKTTCADHTKPITGSKFPGAPEPGVPVLKELLSKMSTPVTLLDVTTMSQLRIDAHPSKYANKAGTAHDCGHWCVGGVTDTWNTLLYESLAPAAK